MEHGELEFKVKRIAGRGCDLWRNNRHELFGLTPSLKNGL
jgi:hypothetical protein